MGTQNKEWIRKCNPCRECGNNPIIKKVEGVWGIGCKNCMDIVYWCDTALNAVLLWNDRNSISMKREVEIQREMAKIDSLDIESIGSIDGTAFAKKIKQIAERLAKMPPNASYMEVATAIHMLHNIIERMPEFKEDKRE